MLRTRNLKFYGLAIAVVLMVCAGSAFAQLPVGPDVFYVTYYSNANTSGAPDGKVRIDNPGLAVTTANPDGTLCADIYVFDTTEEMVECCGCPVTADGLRTISVNSGLTANPSVKGRVEHEGVVKILSALPNPNGGRVCDATGGGTKLGYPNNIVVTPDLRAWATHVQHVLPSATTFPTTSDSFQESLLSATELSTLQRDCSNLWIYGSGTGRCGCGTGD